MKKKKNIQSPEAKGLKKWLWRLVAVVAVIVVVAVAWHMVRYQFNDDYKQYLTQFEAAEGGMTFAALMDDEPQVPGLALHTANENKRIYLDEATGAAAIYDVRTNMTYHYRSLAAAAEEGKKKPKAETEGLPEAEGMALVAQNSTLKLYANGDTGAVAVYDKRSGQTTYSVPPLANKDSKANNTNKGYLKSALTVDYYNSNLIAGSYSSFADSVELGEMEVQSIRNGVRFIYTLGEKKTIYVVPHILSDERYQELYEQVDDSMKRFMYGQKNSFYEQGEDGYWRITENGKKRGIRDFDKLAKAFIALGMTESEYYEWQELAGVESVETLGFTVALDWTLDGDAVVCTVPPELIEERGGGMIYRIQLNNYFAAAGTDEEGYIVVPNGSGSLIHFNNGKQSNAQYSQYIYDMDLVDAEYTKTQNLQSVRLPLFAICRENNTMLATVEEGAAFANITADVSGRTNSYNNAYVIFTIRGDEKLAMFGAGETADMPIVEDDFYFQPLSVRYTILDPAEHTGYTGVANYYRQRLIDEGVLTAKTEGGDIPFFYDVIGGVKETAHTLGVQHLRVAPMTTFEQAGQISDELTALGVDKQVMNLQGWMNGGYYHDVPDKVKVLSQLGGRGDLNELARKMAANGNEIFLDVAFQNVTYISKRYNVNAESSRYYGAGYAVQFGEVHPTTLRRTASMGYAENIYNLLSPKFLPYYVDKFTKAIEDYEANLGISLRDLGYELHADKKRTEVINREEALDVVLGKLDTLQETGRDLMISGGNVYALEGVKYLQGAPMTSTEYFIVDETVPLYQMIVHGCVDYTGKPMNTYVTDDDRETLLHMVEYGAAPRYVFTWEEATEMKYTGMNKYYSATFNTWKQQAAENYAYVNAALNRVSGAYMVGREVLSETLVRVDYSNGISIFVNYGKEAVQSGGNTVEAQDYLLTGLPEDNELVLSAMEALGETEVTARTALTDTLVRVDCADGTILYVNLGAETVEIDGCTVEAMNHFVKGGAKE